MVHRAQVHTPFSPQKCFIKRSVSVRGYTAAPTKVSHRHARIVDAVARTLRPLSSGRPPRQSSCEEISMGNRVDGRNFREQNWDAPFCFIACSWKSEEKNAGLLKITRAKRIQQVGDQEKGIKEKRGRMGVVQRKRRTTCQGKYHFPSLPQQ